MLEQPLLFTGCSSIQFFNSPPFPEHSQLGYTWYPIHLAVKLLCYLRIAMPRHWSPSASNPTLTRGAEDLPGDSKYHKDVPLHTFLAYLQPV